MAEDGRQKTEGGGQKTDDGGRMMDEGGQNSTQLRMTVYASLMAALTAAGAYLAIPIGPVPIVLQNLFIFLSGLLLGRRWGVVSVAVYILVGACGLPIFSIGRGGIGHILGPTGGYLIGYIPAVYLIGIISEKTGQRSVYDVIAMICGSIIIYVFGITWLKILTGMTFSKTLAVGMYPFLLGDAIKIAVAVPIAKAIRPVIRIESGRFTEKDEYRTDRTSNIERSTSNDE